MKNVKKEDFANEIQGQDLVLVDFWAEWCGPCKMIAPVLEDLEKQFQGKIKIIKVNVDQEKELAVDFGIRGIPTIIAFKKGEKIEAKVGAANKAILEQWINKLI